MYIDKHFFVVVVFIPNSCLVWLGVLKKRERENAILYGVLVQFVDIRI